MTRFYGIYIYVTNRQQFGRPIWELPSNPDDKNLRYYPGGWIIHGTDNDVLSYKSDSVFPPIEDLNAEWTHSKHEDGVYHVDDIYDATIEIIYVLIFIFHDIT